MPVTANTFQTYGARGIREDLADIISRVAQEETPFISNAGKETVSNTTFEWQTQALAAPDTNNAHVEGDQVDSFDAVTPTERVANYTQIMRKTFLISNTEDKVRKAGRASEIAYQKVLKGIELKRDAEAIFLSNQGGAIGNGTTTPRRTASVQAWIRTNVSLGASPGANPAAPNPVPAAGRTDGVQRAFTEALLRSVLQSMYRNGAKTDLLMVGPHNKQVVSAFPGIAQQRAETGKKPATIVGTADVYLSDFGPLSIVPNAFMRERDALLIDTDHVAVATLRPYAVTELALNGDARRFLCLQEVGLMCRNERGLGIVADLTTS